MPRLCSLVSFRDKIQVSEETAELIIASGREKWLQPRETKIVAKGKGELQTYWVTPRSGANESSVSGGDNSDSSDPVETFVLPRSSVSMHTSLAMKRELDEKHKRLVHWIAEIMIKLLKQIVARRTAAGTTTVRKKSDTISSHFGDDHDPIEEVQDIITLPCFDQKVAAKQIDFTKVKLPESVLAQLHSYIAEIAMIYR